MWNFESRSKYQMPGLRLCAALGSSLASGHSWEHSPGQDQSILHRQLYFGDFFLLLSSRAVGSDLRPSRPVSRRGGFCLIDGSDDPDGPTQPGLAAWFLWKRAAYLTSSILACWNPCQAA